MWCVFRKTLINTGEITCSVIKETKRFAGHSKWANIKHTKAIQDGEKAILFMKLTRQMRVAITEGGSCKPSENLKLAQTIEIAKKRSMPTATINAVLETAAKSTAKSETAIMDVRGPGGCIILLYVHSDNLNRTRMTVNILIKRYQGSQTDRAARRIFDHKGIVITTSLGDLDLATEKAIVVGAEDVEEFEQDGEKFYKFTCDANELPKVANQLATQKFEVVSTEEIYIPRVYAHLDDDQLEKVATLYKKLEGIPEICAVHDNIA